MEFIKKISTARIVPITLIDVLGLVVYNQQLVRGAV